MRQCTGIKPSPTHQGRLKVTGDIHKAVELLVPLSPSPFFIYLVSILFLSSFVYLYDEFWSFPSLFCMPLSLSQTYSSPAGAVPTFVSSFICGLLGLVIASCQAWVGDDLLVQGQLISS